MHSAAGPGAAAPSAQPAYDPDSNGAAAAAELSKIVRLLEAAHGMGWAERWRWLHRIKGIVASVRAMAEGGELGAQLAVDEHAAIACVLQTIEGLRPTSAGPGLPPEQTGHVTPPGLEDEWREIKLALETLTAKFGGLVIG